MSDSPPGDLEDPIVIFGDGFTDEFVGDLNIQSAVSYTPTLSSAGFTANIRLESLLSYTPNRVRDAWISLGNQTVDYTSMVFNRGAVFRLNSSALSPGGLNGSLFFCDSDLLLDSTWNWSNMAVQNATAGTIYDTATAIISPHIYLILSASALAAITIPYDNTFVPFSDIAGQGLGATMSTLVIIQPDDLEQILVPLGVPFINIAELEFTQDQILNDMILPALKQFYKWFPIEEIGLYPMPDTRFEVTVPPWAVSVVRAYINPGYPVSQAQGNPMLRYFDEVLMSISPRGAFSTPNLNSSRRQGFVDTQSYATYILERAARQGIINYGTRTRIKTFINQGKLMGYSTKRGILEVVWGAMSNQWSDIPFNRLDEVRELAQAYILRAFGMLRKQVRSDIAGGLDYQGFLDRADKLEERVIALWQASSKPAVFRA